MFLSFTGIPSHAADFSLKGTRGSQSGDFNEPYRLYNLDVFEFELNEPMSLYGAVPLMHSHTAKTSTALYWNNAAETFIDVNDGTGSNGFQKETHWISETGVLDAFF